MVIAFYRNKFRNPTKPVNPSKLLATTSLSLLLSGNACHVLTLPIFELQTIEILLLVPGFNQS